jgi:hypothetical protein
MCRCEATILLTEIGDNVFPLYQWGYYHFLKYARKTLPARIFQTNVMARKYEYGLCSKRYTSLKVLNMRRYRGVITAAVTALSLSLVAVPVMANPGNGNGNGNGHGNSGNHGNSSDHGNKGNGNSSGDHGGRKNYGKPDHVDSDISSSDARRIAVNLGLTGYKPLPPGIAKNLALGKPLPPGIAKKRVPGSMLDHLPYYPGYEWQSVGNDLVLVALSTAIVTSIIKGVFD